MLQFGYNVCKGVSKMSEKKVKAEGLVYKGHPLRRIDNLIYYGSMSEKDSLYAAMDIGSIWLQRALKDDK